MERSTLIQVLHILHQLAGEPVAVEDIRDIQKKARELAPELPSVLDCEVAEED